MEWRSWDGISFHLFVNVENFELFHEKFYNIEARGKKIKKQILGLSSKSTLQLWPLQRFKSCIISPVVDAFFFKWSGHVVDWGQHTFGGLFYLGLNCSYFSDTTTTTTTTTNNNNNNNRNNNIIKDTSWKSCQS